MRQAAWLAGTVAGLLLAGAAAAADLDYRFELVREPELLLRVHLTTRGGSGRESAFEVSREWGGVSAGGEDLADLTAHGAGGRNLTVTHPEPHRWRVQHAPGESLFVTYVFHPNHNQESSSPEIHRRPIFNDHLFHVYGELGLLCPGHLNADARLHFTFRWDGFEAAGWRTACSFATGPGPHAAEASLAEWREAVFMAGDFELLQRDVAGRPVEVALAGREWSFGMDEFADLVQRIVGLERGFFADYEYPYYLVTAIPVGSPKSGSRSLGGTGLTHSFSLAMQPDSKLHGDTAHGMDVAWLLAHEMFHNWCGHKIVPADPEQLGYWFSEGFTDFYARRLLLRGGLISLDEYVRGLNAKIADLEGSPVASAPNERIRADFWKSAVVKRLPYLRGDVVAAIADGAIRRASKGTQSLDDLMQALVREAGAGQLRMDTDAMLRRIEALTGEKVAASLRRTVVNGAPPDIAPDTFGPCLELRTVPLGTFDLGFDFERSRAEHRVTGVVPGSRAAAAGLQDGQQLAGWSLYQGNTEQPVQFTIVEGDAKRGITWMPLGPEKPTPQFFPRAEASDSDCKCL
jgi:predicted metalloprotease with PDZ domain